jgi:oxidoreductase
MTIKTAVVGLGWAGRSIWLPQLDEHPDFTVVAAVDPQPDRRAEFAEQNAGILVSADTHALDRSTVDLAIVAVPNHAHADIGAELLSRGIPVFLEKPVCLSLDEADGLAAAERDGGALLLSGSAARHRADVRALAGLVTELGEIRHVDLSWVRARGVPDTSGWFTRRELSGGGVLVDLGWHLLDVLTDLLGPVAVEQAAATTAGDFLDDGAWSAAWRDGCPPARAAGDVEDTVRAFLVTTTGVSVGLHASWASHEAVDTTAIRVEGTTGTAALRCTFGFSPNREKNSTILVTRVGLSDAVPVDHELTGSEYRRQLDRIRDDVLRASDRGKAVDDARRIVTVIDRIYACARGSGTAACPDDSSAKWEFLAR